MKLRELLDTNGQIGEVSVTIRDANGMFIDEIHIGSHASKDTCCGQNHEPRWKVIQKPINYKEVGKDYWGVMLKVIPSELLEKEVKHWRQWNAFSLNNGCWQFYKINVDVLGVDTYIETTATETDQLEGQMSLEDFIGG